jgi:hypothetical protein
MPRGLDSQAGFLAACVSRSLKQRHRIAWDQLGSSHAVFAIPARRLQSDRYRLKHLLHFYVAQARFPAERMSLRREARGLGGASLVRYVPLSRRCASKILGFALRQAPLSPLRNCAIAFSCS